MADPVPFPEGPASGAPLLLSEQCATCVGRPGNLMRLEPGRLRDLVDSNLAAGTLLTCHSTTYGQTGREAICRWFWDRYGDRTATKQVMDRLFGPDWFQEIPLSALTPPTKENPS